ncbi:MAG: hypothetical protein Kow0058_01740 [Roseovarius sp.]
MAGALQRARRAVSGRELSRLSRPFPGASLALPGTSVADARQGAHQRPAASRAGPVADKVIVAPPKDGNRPTQESPARDGAGAKAGSGATRCRLIQRPGPAIRALPQCASRDAQASHHKEL